VRDSLLGCLDVRLAQLWLQALGYHFTTFQVSKQFKAAFSTKADIPIFGDGPEVKSK
jgi:hypothetical protein